MVRKYGPKAQKKVEKVMHEFKRGKLRSSSGDKVKDKKQAIAIGLSEAKREGAKVPPPPRKTKKKTGKRWLDQSKASAR